MGMIFEKQQYQEDCVDNIIEVLKDVEGFADLPSLKTGIEALHKEKKIPQKEKADEARLDVLMETGTGKTFTYLKTMFEINKEFGVNKFVLFVPRTAIKAGVLQAIEATSSYFFNEYGKRLQKHSYEGDGKLHSVNSYVRGSELSVLILTSHSIASNNAADLILTRITDLPLYVKDSPLEAIGKLKPVVFIDEPHLLTGPKFVSAYKKNFTDSLLIRFGATFPNNLSNTVYILDSIKAFKDKLVKKIQVATILDESVGFRFHNPTGSGKNKKVTVLYFRNGEEYKKEMSVGDDVGATIGDSNYKGLSINKIDSNDVYLSNGEKRTLKENYELEEDSIRLMVRDTIKTHFEKEERLFQQGIKTLSLFFIPRIKDFKGDENNKKPRIKTIFEEEYKKQHAKKLKENISQPYKEYLERDFDKENKKQLLVHGGYFSGDKGTKDEREAEGVNLILNTKEKLLSTETPLRFIFSVWALQEGWDNPNIFQICKLASSSKETSRRQQVGRGLRIAVNQQGKRQTVAHLGEGSFYDINTLDVIVSGQEKNFIEEIQHEIISSSYGITLDAVSMEGLMANGLNRQQAHHLITYLEGNDIIEFDEATNFYKTKSPIESFIQNNGEEGLPAPLKGKLEELIAMFKNAGHSPVTKKTGGVGIRKDKANEFKQLWRTITQKAKIRYSEIKDDGLVNRIESTFSKEDLAPLKARRVVEYLDPETNEIVRKSTTELGNIKFFDKTKYNSFVLDFAKSEKLPLPFVCNLFSKIGKEKVRNNPKKAKALLIGITKDKIHQGVVQNISYDFDGEINIHSQSPYSFLYNEDNTPKSTIEQGKLGKYIDKETTPPAQYLYDKIIYDSNIEKDVVLLDGEEDNPNNIIVFAKLPYISIPTPYKSYNPDFAYFIKTRKGKKLFLVVETKGHDKIDDIPERGKTKIAYAEKFFEKLDSTLPDIKVIFKTRTNTTELIDLLKEVSQ